MFDSHHQAHPCSMKACTVLFLIIALPQCHSRRLPHLSKEQEQHQVHAPSAPVWRINFEKELAYLQFDAMPELLAQLDGGVHEFEEVKAGQKNDDVLIRDHDTFNVIFQGGTWPGNWNQIYPEAESGIFDLQDLITNKSTYFTDLEQYLNGTIKPVVKKLCRPLHNNHQVSLLNQPSIPFPDSLSLRVHLSSEKFEDCAKSRKMMKLRKPWVHAYHFTVDVPLSRMADILKLAWGQGPKWLRQHHLEHTLGLCQAQKPVPVDSTEYCGMLLLIGHAAHAAVHQQPGYRWQVAKISQDGLVVRTHVGDIMSFVLRGVAKSQRPLALEMIMDDLKGFVGGHEVMFPHGVQNVWSLGQKAELVLGKKDTHANATLKDLAAAMVQKSQTQEGDSSIKRALHRGWDANLKFRGHGTGRLTVQKWVKNLVENGHDLLSDRDLPSDLKGQHIFKSMGQLPMRVVDGVGVVVVEFRNGLFHENDPPNAVAMAALPEGLRSHYRSPYKKKLHHHGHGKGKGKGAGSNVIKDFRGKGAGNIEIHDYRGKGGVNDIVNDFRDITACFDDLRHNRECKMQPRYPLTRLPVSLMRIGAHRRRRRTSLHQ